MGAGAEPPCHPPNPRATAQYMTTHAFTLLNTALIARPSGALFVPSVGALVVSDLHLGKSDRIARRSGALFPPFETRDTLLRLEAEIEATRPRTVICLGDSFDDLAAAESLSSDETLWISRLQAGREWIWAEGNHDPGPIDLGGTHLSEVSLAGLYFRHIAQSSASGEVSGHYHPKHRLGGQSRPAFLYDKNRLILPAFGTYTGGLWSDSPVLKALLQAPTVAVLTGRKALAVPVI